MLCYYTCQTKYHIPNYSRSSFILKYNKYIKMYSNYAKISLNQLLGIQVFLDMKLEISSLPFEDDDTTFL